MCPPPGKKKGALPGERKKQVSQHVNTKDCYLTVLGLQDVLEQGCLSRTKEAAEQGDRHLVISIGFLKESV